MNAKTILDFLHFSNPTQEQMLVLKAMEEFTSDSNSDDFLILSGAAGTGKTSITAALIGYLNHIDRSYRIAAPTGRAARILGRKSNTYTSTIHSLIYIPKPDPNSGKVSFKLKINKTQAPVIYIIDEASMISKNVSTNDCLFEVEKGLLYDLLQYIKTGNEASKVIFLGDQYQLPPIGESQSFALSKSFLEETFQIKGASYTLTEVKRHENGSYILENATSIRKAIDDCKSRCPIAGKRSKNIYTAADTYVSTIRQNGLENSIAIGVSHKANRFFNDLVRERIYGRAKKTIEKGDLLMVTQNWYRNGIQLYNGDHIQVLEIDWNVQEEVAGLHFTTVKVKLLFSEEEVIIDDYALLESILSPNGTIDSKSENELRNQRYIKNKIFRESNMPGDDRYVGALRLMYGHAITCNKAQGGEWKKVFINTLGIPSLRWQYTAVTRGIEEIEVF